MSGSYRKVILFALILVVVAGILLFSFRHYPYTSNPSKELGRMARVAQSGGKWDVEKVKEFILNHPYCSRVVTTPMDIDMTLGGYLALIVSFGLEDADSKAAFKKWHASHSDILGRPADVIH